MLSIYSIQVTDTKHGRGQRFASKRDKKHVAELADLEWHKLGVHELCQRLGVAAKVGLDGEMASRRLAKDERNAISPPPKNLPKKVGFGLRYMMVFR